MDIYTSELTHLQTSMVWEDILLLLFKQNLQTAYCSQVSRSWLKSLHSLTASSGPALVGVVRKDWASQNSIALSWSEVEQPPSDIVDYEVKYYEKVKSFIILNKVVWLSWV